MCMVLDYFDGVTTLKYIVLRCWRINLRCCVGNDSVKPGILR